MNRTRACPATCSWTKCWTCCATPRPRSVGDVACRYGGEEFVVLLPECGVDVASGRAERLREAIAATLPNADGGGPERVTASVGVAKYPNHGGEAESLFWAADKALYRAKQMGRNRVVTVGD